MILASNCALILILLSGLLIHLVNSTFHQWKSRFHRSQDPKMKMTAAEIVEYYGYPVEIHPIITPDGYILELHRIPPRKCGRRQARIVFFQHGFIGTSAQWLKNDFDISLAYQLADLGYDVWLGNSRGNTYSRRHVWLDPADPGPGEPAYWDFSWHEMGFYDLDTSISYALKVGRQEKLSYVCISFGCTLFFIATIEQPTLNHHIESAFALAPSTFLAHMKNPFLKGIVSSYHLIVGSAKLVGVRAFADANFEGPLRSHLRKACLAKQIHPSTCQTIFSRLDVVRDFFLSMMPEVDRHFPAGTSYKTLAQFYQNAKAGDSFRAFDYGSQGNLRQYGTLRPPSYDLSRVTAPVYIFWSQTDVLATPEDVALLASRLGNLKAFIAVSDDEFGHFDFLNGPHLNRTVNRPIISLLPPPCS